MRCAKVAPCAWKPAMWRAPCLARPCRPAPMWCCACRIPATASRQRFARRCSTRFLRPSRKGRAPVSASPPPTASSSSLAATWSSRARWGRGRPSRVTSRRSCLQARRRSDTRRWSGMRRTTPPVTVGLRRCWWWRMSQWCVTWPASPWNAWATRSTRRTTAWRGCARPTHSATASTWS